MPNLLKSLPTRLTLFQNLLYLLAAWSLIAILTSAGSLLYFLGNPTYGGFLWSWDSTVRLYKPDDTYIQRTIQEVINPSVFITEVDGKAVHPRDTTAYYQTLWDGCQEGRAPTLEEQSVTYTLRLADGQTVTTEPMPLFCFNAWDVFFNWGAVLPAAIFFWFSGFVILLSIGYQPYPLEKAFALSSVFVLFILAAFMGKQVYLEQGIDFGYGRLSILLVTIPTAVWLPPAVWLNMLLLPPAWRSQPSWLGRVLITSWAVIITFFTYLQFATTPPPASFVPPIRLISTSIMALTVLGLLSMAMRSLHVSRKTDNPFYKRQAKFIGRSLLLSGGTIFFLEFPFIRLPATFPTQELLLATMSLIVLMIAFGILNSLILPQFNSAVRLLPFLGLSAFLISLYTAVLKQPEPGLQLLWGSTLLVTTLVFLRAPHRWQPFLQRLTTYRYVRSEDIETFIQQTNQVDSLSQISPILVHSLVDLLALRGASLWLMSTTESQFEPITAYNHQPPRDQLPISFWQNAPFLTRDMTLDGTPMLVLPLQNGPERLGLLMLGISLNQPSFGRADEQALQAIAAHTALIISQAQQLTRARHTAVAEQDIRLGEREQLGRDLHDTVLQDLSTFRWTLMRLPKHPELAEEAEDQLLEATRQIRAIVTNLDQDRFDLYTIQDYLAHYLERCRTQYPAVAITAVFDPHPSPSDKQKRDFLLACRQALDNALKHAHATQLQLRVAHDADLKRLCFEVRDDGRGFEVQSPTELLKRGHVGLYTMESRLQAYGGKLEIQTKPQQGTTITGYLPLLLANSG